MANKNKITIAEIDALDREMLIWRCIWIVIVVSIYAIGYIFVSWVSVKEQEFFRPKTEEEIATAKRKKHHQKFQRHTLLCTAHCNIPCPFPRAFDERETSRRVEQTVQYASQLYSVQSIL